MYRAEKLVMGGQVLTVGVGVRVGVRVGPLGVQRMLRVDTPLVVNGEITMFPPAVPVLLIA